MRTPKFFVALPNKGKVTMLRADGIEEIRSKMPPVEDILFNLITQKKRQAAGYPYLPIRVNVTEQEFKQIEIAINKKQRHKFIRKDIDIINDNKYDTPLVQFVQN